MHEQTEIIDGRQVVFSKDHMKNLVTCEFSTPIDYMDDIKGYGPTPVDAFRDLKRKYTEKYNIHPNHLNETSIMPKSPYTPEMEAIIDAKNLVISNAKDSREKSMVITKLDEAYLWLKELETAGTKA